MLEDVDNELYQEVIKEKARASRNSYIIHNTKVKKTYTKYLPQQPLPDIQVIESSPKKSPVLDRVRASSSQNTVLTQNVSSNNPVKTAPRGKKRKNVLSDSEEVNKNIIFLYFYTNFYQEKLNETTKVAKQREEQLEELQCLDEQIRMLMAKKKAIQ